MTILSSNYSFDMLLFSRIAKSYPLTEVLKTVVVKLCYSRSPRPNLHRQNVESPVKSAVHKPITLFTYCFYSCFKLFYSDVLKENVDIFLGSVVLPIVYRSTFPLTSIFCNSYIRNLRASSLYDF